MNVLSWSVNFTVVCKKTSDELEGFCLEREPAGKAWGCGWLGREQVSKRIDNTLAHGALTQSTISLPLSVR